MKQWAQKQRPRAERHTHKLFLAGGSTLPGPHSIQAWDSRVKQQLVRTLVEEIVVDVDDATRCSSSVIHAPLAASCASQEAEYQGRQAEYHGRPVPASSFALRSPA